VKEYMLLKENAGMLEKSYPGIGIFSYIQLVSPASVFRHQDQSSTIREKGERAAPPCTWKKETLSTDTTAFLGRNHGYLSKG
jgi:hypothetical protein